MKEKNLAVELLKKLIAEQVSIYRRTNVVKSEKFSEIIQSAMNRYLNGMLTNEEVIEELLKLAKDIAAANAEGEKLGLTAEELAFYDALTKPQAIKDFYEHDEASVYKGYKRDKIEKRGDRAEMSDFPLYLNTVAGGLDCRNQAIGGFSFVVKIYALPVVKIIGQFLYLLG